MKLSVRAFAIAFGILWWAAVLLVGLANQVWPPYGLAFLEAVASVYPGYQAAGGYGSVFIGAMYALVDGAVAGLLFAWLYNLAACAASQKETPAAA